MAIITTTEVAKLYLATFGRPLDSTGLEYWTNTGAYAGGLGTSITTMEGLAASFAVQPEFTTSYPSSLTTTAFVTAIYDNLLGRAPDAEGLGYWVDKLDGTNNSGLNPNLTTDSKDSFILIFINGAQDSVDGNDLTLINNRADVALYLANKGNLTEDMAKDASVIAEVMAVNGDSDTAAVTAAKTAADAAIVAVNEAPTIDAMTAVSYNENTTVAAGTTVATATVADADTADTVTLSVSDSRFAIDASGVITTVADTTFDFETEPTITLTVTATDSIESTTSDLTINVANISEGTMTTVATSLENVDGAAIDLDSAATFTSPEASFTGWTITVNGLLGAVDSTSTLNRNDDIVLSVDGTNITEAANVVFAGLSTTGTAIGTFVNTATTAPTASVTGVDGSYVLTLNSSATAAHIQTFLQNIQVDTVQDGTNSTITVEIADANGTVVATNDTVLEFVDAALAFTGVEDESELVTISASATAIFDAAATNNFLSALDGSINGATLEVEITAGADTTDALSFLGAGTANSARDVAGLMLAHDGTETNIGTVTNSGQKITVTFNSSATDALINEVLRDIAFDTTNGDGDRTITTTLTTTAGTTESVTSTVSVSSSSTNLTAGTDDFTGTNTGAGTAGVDVFNAAAGNLVAADSIDGGASNDRLVAVLNSGTNIAPTLDSVETIDATISVTNSGLDLQNATGTTTVNLLDTGNVNTAVIGITSDVTRVNASNMDGSGTLAVTVATDEAGSLRVDTGAGAATITMANTLDATDDINGKDNVAGDTLTATINGLDATTGALNISGIETITLTGATAASTIDMTGVSSDATGNNVTLNLLGDQDITLTNVDSEVTTIDASTGATMTAGDLTVTFTETTDGVVTVTTVGDASSTNTINMGTTLTGTVAQTLNAGNAVAGVTAVAGDKITGSTAAATNIVNATVTHDITIGATEATGSIDLTGIDQLNLTVALANEGNEDADDGTATAAEITTAQTDDSTLTIQEEGNDFHANTGITTFSFTGGAAGETVDLSDIVVNDGTGDDTTITATNLASDLDITATLADVDAGDTDAATLTVTGGTGSDSVTVTAGSNITSATDADGAYLVTTNVENVVISGGANPSIIDVAGVNGADIAINQVATNALTVQNAHGNVTVTTNNVTPAAITVTADAAMAFTGSDGVETVTGSSAADSFTFARVDADGAGSGTTMADSFAGTDTIDGGTGTDSLTATLAATTINPDINDVESITLSLTNGTTIDATEITHTTDGSVTLTLTGAGSADLSKVNAAVGTIDASGLTTGLTLTLTAGDLQTKSGANRDLTVVASSAADTFIIDGDEADLGSITIQNFTAGNGVFADRLDFKAMIDGAAGAYNSYSDVSIAQTGTDTVITAKPANGNETFTITLEGVDASTLNQTSNFIFEATTTVEAAVNTNAGNTIYVKSGTPTLTALDASGVDTLYLTDGDADISGAGFALGVENIVLEDAGNLTIDDDSISGAVNVVGSEAAGDTLTVDASGGDVDVSGVTITGFETLAVSAGTNGVILTTAQLEAFDTVTVAATNTVEVTTAINAASLDNVAVTTSGTITLADATNTITTVDGLAVGAATVTIDNSAATSATSVFTFDGSAETTGDFIITSANSTAGADITGSQGDDTFNLDVGNAEVINILDTNGADTIGSGAAVFTNGEDLLDFSGVTAAGTLAKVAITNGAADAAFTVDGTNTTVYVIDTDATDIGATTDPNADAVGSVDFSVIAEVGAFLNEAVTTSNVAGEVHYFLINDGSVATASYLYKFVDDGSDTALDADGSELTLIGTLTTDATATTIADITIA
jgi:hypothetical protein